MQVDDCTGTSAVGETCLYTVCVKIHTQMDTITELKMIHQKGPVADVTMHTTITSTAVNFLLLLLFRFRLDCMYRFHK